MARTKKEDINDVRIMTYDTCKGKVTNISFHDSLSQLIADDGSRVALVVSPSYPNRLYFVPHTKNTKKRGAVKLANDKLQFAERSVVKMCSSFIGEYQLQYDDVAGSKLQGLYYVNKDKVVQPGYRGGNSKVPHPNYTSGKRVAIPKKTIVSVKKTIAIPKSINEQEVREIKSVDKGAIIELLDVLDTYDKNKAVYEAGHTLIKTIKEML